MYKIFLGKEKHTVDGQRYQTPTPEQFEEIEDEIGSATDGKRAVGYIRVSTLGQTRADRYGMEEQRDMITKYCDEHGLYIVGWYVDAGESGVKESRPALDSLLFGTLKNPAINYVICAKSDRMARDIKLYYYYLMLLEKKGIELISATEEIVNDSSGMGAIYKSLMLFVAEQERKNITMRTSGGRSQKAKAGGYSGGRVPFGYKSVAGRLIIEPREADIVRQIYFLYSRGMAASAIAQYLNHQGVKGRNGEWIALSTIVGILKREKLYRGYYQYGNSGWVKGQQEPILNDEAMFPSVDETDKADDTQQSEYPRVLYRMDKDVAIAELQSYMNQHIDDGVINRFDNQND